MSDTTPFELVEIGLAAIRACRPLIGKVNQYDSQLADRLRQALTAAPLRAAQASHARKGARLAKLHAAKSEAAAAETALHVAVAFGYVSESAAGDVLRDLDHFMTVAGKLVSPQRQ